MAAARSGGPDTLTHVNQVSSGYKQMSSGCCLGLNVLGHARFYYFIHLNWISCLFNMVFSAAEKELIKTCYVEKGWLVVLGFNATLTAKVISWRLVMHMCFPGFLTPVLTQLFFPKPPTTFLTCFCRSERQKYAGKKSHLNRGSNSQPPGHESDTLVTEPSGWGCEKRMVRDTNCAGVSV